jgi:hypothetical protein
VIVWYERMGRNSHLRSWRAWKENHIRTQTSGFSCLALCNGHQADPELKIACPVLSLWGTDFEAVGKSFDMPKSGARWRTTCASRQSNSAGISHIRSSPIESTISSSLSWLVGTADVPSQRAERIACDHCEIDNDDALNTGTSIKRAVPLLLIF